MEELRKSKPGRKEQSKSDNEGRPLLKKIGSENTYIDIYIYIYIKRRIKRERVERLGDQLMRMREREIEGTKI